MYRSSLLMLHWLFTVCEIAHFGYNSATVCLLFHLQLSAPKPFIPVLTTRFIKALPLPRCHCRISIVETQTCLQALSLLSAYNTLHSACISSDCAKKYFQFRIAQIKPGRQSNVAFITKILQMCCWMVIFFFRGNFFKGKMPKGQIVLFTPTNLKRGQVSQIWQWNC